MSWFFIFFFLHWDLDTWSFLFWAFDFVFCFGGCFVFVVVQASFFFLWLFLQCSGEEAVIIGLKCYFPLWDQHSGPQILT